MTRWRTYLLLGVLAVVALTAWRVNRRLKTPSPVDPARIAWTAKALPSVAFVLDASQALEYSVPDGSRVLRLLFNADLPPGILEEGLRADRPRRPRPYRVEIEETDYRGRLLARRTWTFLADVTPYRDPVDKGLRASLFYLDRDSVPSSTREILLEVREPQRVQGVRLKLLPSDGDVRDVIVRAYSPIAASPTRLGHGWDRLADPIRAQLLAGNVYPEGLLREDEKRNLLSRPWEPLAPNSSWGPRPREVLVYQRLDALEAEPGTDYEPQGVKVDATRQAVIPLPRAGARVRLEVRAWPTPPARSSERMPVDTVDLHWVGAGPGQRSFRRLPWPDPILSLETPYEGGYLLLSASRPGFVRAWRRADQGEEEITPVPEQLGCALLEPGQELVYTLPPSLDRSLPFRLDLRRILTDPSGLTARIWVSRSQISERWPMLRAQGSPVTYELLDVSGRALQTGSLPVDQELSPFEALPPSFGSWRLALPATTTLLTPPAARHVKVSLKPGTVPVLVTAFDHAPDAPRLQVVPDDFFRFDTRESRIPDWFPVRPEGVELLTRHKRWVPLRTQPLPEVGAEAALEEPFELDPLRPLDGIPARELMAPNEMKGLPPREDGLTSYFREIRPGREELLTFRARAGVQALRPSLLWMAPKSPASGTLSLDGLPQVQFKTLAPFQEVLLPPIAPGARRLHLEAGGRVFVSHVWPSPQDWVKRLGHPIGPGQVRSFAHTRPASLREGLTLRFCAAAAPGKEAVLALRILGPVPPTGSLHPSLTATERRFRFRLEPGRAAHLLHGAAPTLAQGPLLPVNLGPDLPPGAYRLECRLESGTAGFLSISRSQRGSRPKTLMDRDAILGEAP